MRDHGDLLVLFLITGRAAEGSYTGAYRCGGCSDHTAIPGMYCLFLFLVADRTLSPVIVRVVHPLVGVSVSMRKKRDLLKSLCTTGGTGVGLYTRGGCRSRQSYHACIPYVLLLGLYLVAGGTLVPVVGLVAAPICGEAVSVRKHCELFVFAPSAGLAGVGLDSR